MRPQPTSIHDVAARAGVSAATVSRALRGIPGVALRTRQTVEQAAHDLGYIASPSASGLSTGRTGAVGIVTPWLSRWFFAAAIEGIRHSLVEYGYDALLYPAAGDVPDEHARRAGLDLRALNKRVDGVIALNVPIGVSSLREIHVPLVTIGGNIPGIAGVVIDDVAVGRDATKHLLNLGHCAIAFIGEDPDAVFGFTAAADRLRGYREELAAAGITAHPGLVEVSGFGIEQAGNAFRRMWEKVCRGELPTVTAVFAVNDEAAIGVLRAASELGLRVPADVSVIGVDNHDLSYLFDLTTIAQPVREQGRLAAQMMIESIRGGTFDCPMVIGHQLIMRKSTGIAPGPGSVPSS
jgi:LacI family transcriptional regulator, repressor for deo operon, udp, cdd, tsx, nupC, and nupG